nr:hypothetical protein [Actinomycetota bacterium]
SPSGAASSGETATDERATDGRAPVEQAVQADATSGAPVARAVPGQLPGPAVPPVPVPGTPPGMTYPAVMVGEAPSPEDGIEHGEKSEDSDASTASPGSYVALAPPGYPDGTNDTRAR